jgi:phosphoribosylanthranilate isomerase
MLDENLIQIAGVIDAAEAEMLQQCGIRYLGFPLRLPVHREDLTEEEAAQRSLTLFEMTVVVITSEREKIFLTFFSIVVDERKFIKHFGVDYQLVWDVVQEKLPELKRNVQSIIDKLQQA